MSLGTDQKLDKERYQSKAIAGFGVIFEAPLSSTQQGFARSPSTSDQRTLCQPASNQAQPK